MPKPERSQWQKENEKKRPNIERDWRLTIAEERYREALQHSVPSYRFMAQLLYHDN